MTSGPPVLRMAGWPGSPARERMPSAATLHRDLDRDARLLRESLLQPGRRLEASVAEAVRSQERASLEAKLSEA